MKHSLVVLTALVLVLGAQLFRVLLPSLTWYWRATLGLTAGQLVVATCAPSMLAWLAPRLAQRLGLRPTLRAFGAGLLLCRLVEQFSTSAAVDVWASLAGWACLLGLLPLLYLLATEAAAAGRPAFALGLLLGLALDTALRGVTGTLDLSWIPGAWPRLLIGGLVIGVAVLLVRVRGGPTSLRPEDLRAGLPLIGLGPFLFVEWLILQHQGWVTTLTGWPPLLALTWILLGNAGALAAAAYVLASPSRRARALAWAAGVGLVGALLVAETPGWVFAVGELVGLISAGVLVAGLVGASPPPAGRARVASVGLVFSLALLSVPILTTLYYVSFLVPLLPFPRSALAPLSGVGLALCALAANWPQRRSPGAPAANWLPARLGGLLLLVPLALWGWPGTAAHPTQPVDRSVRVMTYNIRAAFGLDGRLDVEAIAQVIEEGGADVVGLQELSRGWLISGSVDLLPLLSRRLDLPEQRLGPAPEPAGGNALLSRYPMAAGGHADLPSLDALVGRGYVWAQFDWDAGEPLVVVNTHLDADRADVRLAQLKGLLSAWAGRPHTVLVGDMNARPGSAEIELILAAGFIDAWSETGQVERARIDWIFHTPDLAARDVVIIESPASDHPAYAATIIPKP